MHANLSKHLMHALTPDTASSLWCLAKCNVTYYTMEIVFPGIDSHLYIYMSNREQHQQHASFKTALSRLVYMAGSDDIHTITLNRWRTYDRLKPNSKAQKWSLAKQQFLAESSSTITSRDMHFDSYTHRYKIIHIAYCWWMNSPNRCVLDDSCHSS